MPGIRLLNVRNGGIHVVNLYPAPHCINYIQESQRDKNLKCNAVRIIHTEVLICVRAESVKRSPYSHNALLMLFSEIYCSL